MTLKLNLKNGTIETTMLGPLWARATYSERYPDLLNDPKASQIIKKLDYNFSEVQELLDEWRGLGLLVRARSFDNALKKYMEKNPNTTVVNIGAGLDTTFYRVDNGKIKWYDLDLPDAIEFRKQFIPESPRNKYIARSVLDYSWFDDVEFHADKGIFFIAGGFIYYFKEEEISTLFRAMAERFRGGEIIFDAISKLAKIIMNRRVRKAGAESKPFCFSVGNPMKKFPKWPNKIEVVDWFTIWARAPRNPNWSKKTIKMINIAERFKTAKIVQVRFLK